jgi:DNA-binding NtrC family response regulator
VGSDVLLVDDDEDVLDSIGDLIALVSKRQVRMARSLVEVERLSGELGSFGLALIDVNLGAGTPSGLDVLRWLRSRHFAGRIGFLTGHAGDFPLVQEARAAGVEMFSKPIGVDALRALVDGKC